ncbi:MAG: hypothetical protein AAF587_01540 [Bacteroidota bacterium]
MKSNVLLFIVLFSIQGIMAQSGQYHSRQWDDPYDEPGAGQHVQVALLLDVSGSMDGLLDQAKSQLWHIVNGLVWQMEGPYPPRIEIALYEYGKENIGSHRRYMRMVVPFTEDLDWVSEALFQLRTGGRREYCGAVLEQATHELMWDHHPETLRLLYIAGNESFQQGPVSPRSAINFAKRNGIQVNTIFCGSYSYGVKYGWKEAAHHGGGTFSTIDMNMQDDHHIGPWDREVILLNTQLNQTYIPYGPDGVVCYQRQLSQDRNIESCGPVYFSQRILTKASGVYYNPKWDLIDAVSSGYIKLVDIPSHHLPREMRGMSLQEKERYIQRKRMERNRLQNRIRANRTPRTPTPRRPTVQAESPRSVRGRTLDQAILESVEQSPRSPRTPSRSERPHRTPVETSSRQNRQPNSGRILSSSGTRSAGSVSQRPTSGRVQQTSGRRSTGSASQHSGRVQQSSNQRSVGSASQKSSSVRTPASSSRRSRAAKSSESSAAQTTSRTPVRRSSPAVSSRSTRQSEPKKEVEQQKEVVNSHSSTSVEKKEVKKLDTNKPSVPTTRKPSTFERSSTSKDRQGRSPRKSSHSRRIE